MGWRMDDLAALDHDEIGALLRLVREGKIKKAVF